MNTPLVIYSLECGHAVSAPSSLVNGKLFCPWHDSMEAINGIVVWEWRAKCDSCIYSRWAGLVKNTAELFANGHARRNPAHHVCAEYIVNPVAQKTQTKYVEWSGKKHSTQ